ncbi:MAG TPA: VWA domain-containing protein [Chloroflexia bacterium]|nr:VWA domain-containing protein [Chloroflexia bacterium]
MFLLDRSDSISPQAREQAAQYVRDSIAGMGSKDAAGVIVFGSDALVDRPVVPEKAPPDLASKPGGTYSNLDEALRLGLAISPADTSRRLVLVSDGRENAGNAELASRLAAAHGTPIDIIQLPTVQGPEVWVDALKAPSPVREGEDLALEVSVSSSTDTTATLRLLMDGTAINSQTVKLNRGANTYVQGVPPAVRGFHTYSAEVLPAQGADTRHENNKFSAYSLVLGKPRILVVEGHAGDAVSLRQALQASIETDVLAPEQMPVEPKSLVGYDGLVLVNVPASSLQRRSMESLQIAVRDLGKGLVVIGGDESYAAGGYFRTPLEEMLPVALNLPSKLDIPSVGMALVIDRSGSMDMAHDVAGRGVKKIELAKEAASLAVSQLSERDYAGVITFDSGAEWVVEVQALGDPAMFKNRIGTITSGGGTNIYAGLSPAVDGLITSKAKSKHIVLLTDGVSEPGDYEGLAKKMEANGITLSTVAVGADADTNLMQSLAIAGKGRYYYTENGDALPQIFAHESHLASRSYLIEHDFTPERTGPSPILEGLGGLPAISGYVGTSPRPSGQVVLVSDAGDPLLAQWQYGLGRVVAWTSDAKGQWAREWVGWEGFPRFWGQAVGWSTGAEKASLIQPRVELDRGTAHIVVDAASPDGSFLNDLKADALVVAPSLVTSTVALKQTAAGRYEGEFPAPEEGAYLLRVQASGSTTGNTSQTLGMVVPYSPEYKGTPGDGDLLPRLAAITGGRNLSPDAVAAPFEHNLPRVQSTADLWPLFLLLAILLLPFDIGVRRLAVTRADIERALAEVGRRLGIGRRVVPAVPGASSPSLGALFEARDRARDRTTQVTRDARAPIVPAPPARDLQLPGRSGRPLGVPLGEEIQAPGQRGVTGQVEPGPEAEQQDDSLATRLRKARDQRR